MMISPKVRFVYYTKFPFHQQIFPARNQMHWVINMNAFSNRQQAGQKLVSWIVSLFLTQKALFSPIIYLAKESFVSANGPNQVLFETIRQC